MKETESIKAALAAHQNAMQAVIAHIEAQAAEIERLRADAERYRWLKNAKGLTLESERGSPWTREDGTKFMPSHRICAGGTQFGPHELLDDAIDAAMKETP